MKKLFMLIVLSGFIGLSLNPAQAAPVADNWYACSPTAVGPDVGTTMVYLTGCTDNSGAVDVGWVALDSIGSKEMLATFLTAMSLQKPLSVHISGTWADEGGYVYSKVVGLQLFNW